MMCSQNVHATYVSFQNPTSFSSFLIMSKAPVIPVSTISIARHLVGHDVDHVLAQAWSAPDVSASTRDCFNNVGFNLPVHDNASAIQSLKEALKSQEWEGLIVGWCIRSHPEFTELFELVIAACVDHLMERRCKGQPLKIMFCSGPDDLVNTTLRNFPPVTE